MNVDPTYEIGRNDDFLPFWKLGILELVHDFVVCTEIFLEVIGPDKDVKQGFFMNSKFLTGLYYRFCYVLQHQFSIGCSGRTTTMMIIMSMMKTMSITSEIFNLCCICFAEKHDFSVCNVRRCFNVVFVSSRVG